MAPYNYQDWYCFAVYIQGAEDTNDLFFFYVRHVRDIIDYFKLTPSKYVPKHGFFSGINITRPDMQDKMHIYYNNELDKRIVENVFHPGRKWYMSKCALICYAPSPNRAFNIRDTDMNLNGLPNIRTFPREYLPRLGADISLHVELSMYTRLNILCKLTLISPEAKFIDESDFPTEIASVLRFDNYNQDGVPVDPPLKLNIVPLTFAKYAKELYEITEYFRKQRKNYIPMWDILESFLEN